MPAAAGEWKERLREREVEVQERRPHEPAAVREEESRRVAVDGEERRREPGHAEPAPAGVAEPDQTRVSQQGVVPEVEEREPEGVLLAARPQVRRDEGLPEDPKLEAPKTPLAGYRPAAARHQAIDEPRAAGPEASRESAHSGAAQAAAPGPTAAARKRPEREAVAARAEPRALAVQRHRGEHGPRPVGPHVRVDDEESAAKVAHGSIQAQRRHGPDY